MKVVRDEARSAHSEPASDDTTTLDPYDDELDRFAADGEDHTLRPAKRGWPSSSPQSAAAHPSSLKRRNLLVAALAVVLAVVLAASVVYLQFWPQANANPSVAATGEVTIDSTPAGARVLVDGV